MVGRAYPDPIFGYCYNTRRDFGRQGDPIQAFDRTIHEDTPYMLYDGGSGNSVAHGMHVKTGSCAALAVVGDIAGAGTRRLGRGHEPPSKDGPFQLASDPLAICPAFGSSLSGRLAGLRLQ